jgi:hypothetical protein
MHRRNFNKTLAGLGVSLLAPSQLTAAPIALKTSAPYGFTEIEMSVSFNLDQIFAFGSLETFEEYTSNAMEKGIVTLNISFYDKHGIEQALQVEGLAKDRKTILTRKKADQDFRPNKKYFYKFKNLIATNTETEEVVDLSAVLVGEKYTFTLYWEDEYNTGSSILKDFEIKDTRRVDLKNSIMLKEN